MKWMQELERTEDHLTKSLKELNDKNTYDNVTLDLVGKTLDAMKDLCKLKEEENPSYGRGGMWTAEGSYNGMIPNMYGRRDGDGDGRYYEGRSVHYGNNYNGNYGNRGSYNGMYGHNEDMVEKLRRDMQNAQSESERDYIRRLLRQYE